LLQEIVMKDTKPAHEVGHSTSRYTKAAERPDNGASSSRGCGPSSGAHKDNPHKRTKLMRHA
jgi:hypothetical protein